MEVALTQREGPTRGFPPVRERRSWAIGFLVTMAAFIIVAGVGANWPPASASQRDLRRAYPGRRVRIQAFKSYSMVEACGVYGLDGRPEQLKFLEQDSGLSAERKPGQWDAAGVQDPVQAEWVRCENPTGRGHTFDLIVDPIVVLMLSLA